ncbi:hypothetical protein TNCV_2484821 [Trichonephila clavipes]|uniref:Uncharacterized protein n=1 Tax=Trichonephila clavipes TaxID=2585209 RepID=A0A8X6VZP4_TRICX|nr:hypothetical protein TNCV_2484821 [Trichonephila clavipes]
MGNWQWNGHVTPVAKITDSWPVCHKLELGLLKRSMHVKYVEAQTSSRWYYRSWERGEAQLKGQSWSHTRNRNYFGRVKDSTSGATENLPC